MKLRSLSIAALAVVAGALAFVPTSAQESEPTNECAPEADIRYVGVDSISPDTILLDGPDWLSDVVAQLRFNQRVELLGEKEGGYTKVRTTAGDKQVEGWVKADILMESSVGYDSGRATDGVDTAALHAKSGPGDDDVERGLRRESELYHRNANQVDRLIEFINERLGGDPMEPTPLRFRDNLKSFVDEGGLEPGVSE